MKNYSKITENKDILTKEYADSLYADKSSVPAAVTESTVSGWGFTKNTGTVTSIAIKMNGSEKGKVTSSGTIDLGTVITSHQDISGKQDKITSTNKLPASLVSGLATVATSGSYTDLSNKPTIPTDTGATSVEVTGTGNAVTTASYNATNRKLTLTKGSTFLTSHQDISGKANLSGGNTFSGLQTVNAPTNSAGTEQATAKFKTANGGSITFGKEGPNSGSMIRLDQTDGTCRLRFRSSSTAGAMVWEQPEQGAKLFVDLGKSGADYHRIEFPSTDGTLALTYQIPTSSTVSGWGFTKNTGTITGIKMNGESKGTSGVVDLGTVITADGGTINKSKTVKMDASANSNGANLKWGTVNSKNPYIGYASDQTDGTFVVGSLLGTNYASGLAIGGGSGNLLWKGTKVATTSDIPDISGKLDKTAFSLSGTTLTITI